MKYDVQVVRLIKTTSEKPVQRNDCADYICLGHFDMMHIVRLGDEVTNPLLEIQKDRDAVGESGFGCPENYVYSLYLLKQIQDESKKALDNFWRSPQTYTVVTRLHCDATTDQNEETLPFSTLIENFCIKHTQLGHRVKCKERSKSSSNCVISLTCAANQNATAKADVDCLFYDSLELGDTVAIMKSNSVAAILEAVRCISSYSCVRDTYSYCGINRVLVQDSSIDLSSYIAENAELAQITTRFSVRHIKNADKFLKKLANGLEEFAPQCYVTGTADRSIHWKICSEKRLIEIMRILTKESNTMHLCFNDVITRIGISQNYENQSDDNIEELDLPDITKAIPLYDTTLNWLREDLKEQHAANWEYTLLKLLCTLKSMYTNYVMDDLADLLIPSVCAFLERIDCIRSRHGNLIPDVYDEDIIQFLDCWIGLSNDIAQLESQLTQHPELSPVRYYVPAMILQFEMNFVKFCCNAFSPADSRDFVPMLIPGNAMALNTFCPLDPREEDYDGSCPLLVNIPSIDLYHPWETACRIAHEMAHYCDDPSRERTTRFETLLQCATVYIAKCWYAQFIEYQIDDDQKTLYAKSLEYADSLYHTLRESILSKYPNEKWYCATTEVLISQEVLAILSSMRHLEQFLLFISPEYFFSHGEDYVSLRERLLWTGESFNLKSQFDLHQDLLAFLCSECYADIAMVILTKCTFEDYYETVYREEYNRFFKWSTDLKKLHTNPFIMRQVVRMALVVQAISHTYNDNSWVSACSALAHSESNSLLSASIEIVKASNSGKKSDILSEPAFASTTDVTVNPDTFAYIEDFKLIGTYLLQCTKKLDDELNQPASERASFVDAVRNGIQYIRAGSFDWSKVQQYILNNRSH